MTLGKLDRTSTSVRVSVLALTVAATAGFAFLKWTSSGPLFGFSSTFDFYMLGLLWAFVLWLLGYTREPGPAPQADRTLDNMAWHLDSVRSASLPEGRAANVGGAFLSWVVVRDHLRLSNVVGMEESIEEFKAGRASVAELYEDFGEKLTTSLLKPAVAAFSEQYFEIPSGQFFADLESALGPDPLAVEITPEHLVALHELIDERLEEWNP